MMIMAIVIIITIVSASHEFGEKTYEIPHYMNGFSVAERPADAGNNENAKCFGQNNFFDTVPNSARENCSSQSDRRSCKPYNRANNETSILKRPNQNLSGYQLKVPDDNGDFSCVKLISLESTVNLYGQVVTKCEDADPLQGITIEVENTDISCTTGIDGDFMLANVPIKKQKLNFYDADHEYIDSVELFFNIDGGDICLCSLHKMIIDVGNSDGKIFTNIQICFEMDLETRTLYYEEDKIRGNVESEENKTLYAIICILFVFAFLSVIIFVGKKKA